MQRIDEFQIGLPSSLEDLHDRISREREPSDADRFYWFPKQVIPDERKPLLTADHFSAYLADFEKWDVPRTIYLYTPVPGKSGSPEGNQPVTSVGDIDRGSAASSSRDSSRQSAFRKALLMRDGAEKCALCDAPDNIHAAHILPWKTPPAELRGVDCLDPFQACNGILLCSACHEYFDAFLWSVDACGNVVVSNALLEFVDVGAAYRTHHGTKFMIPSVGRNFPDPRAYAYHHTKFKEAQACRVDVAAVLPHTCGKCQQRFKKEKRRDAHEASCTALSVTPSSIFTPVRERGGRGEDG